MQIYARLLRLSPPGAVSARSSRHYTLYPQFDNIVPGHLLFPLEAFSERSSGAVAGCGPSYFIGQPLQEVFPAAVVLRVREFLRGLEVNYYVRHPREESVLREDIPFLDKEGELAEVAILRSANGRRPRVFGFFSAVLLNLSDEVADRNYLSLPDAPGEQARCDLMAQVGCRVLSVPQAFDARTAGCVNGFADPPERLSSAALKGGLRP